MIEMIWQTKNDDNTGTLCSVRMKRKDEEIHEKKNTKYSQTILHVVQLIKSSI